MENREGGSATIGTSAVVTAEPDGHTLGRSANSALANQPITKPDLAYDGPDDYTPIIKLADLPTVLTVAADAPWQSIQEFVQHAKGNPGDIRVSVSGARTVPDLNVQELNQIAHVEITTVPFTGGAPKRSRRCSAVRWRSTPDTPLASVVRWKPVSCACSASSTTASTTPSPEAESFPKAGYDVTVPAAYYTIAPAELPEDVLELLLEASKEALATEEFQTFAQENGYIVDPIITDEIAAELERYRQTFEALYEFLGD